MRIRSLITSTKTGSDYRCILADAHVGLHRAHEEKQIFFSLISKMLTLQDLGIELHHTQTHTLHGGKIRGKKKTEFHSTLTIHIMSLVLSMLAKARMFVKPISAPEFLLLYSHKAQQSRDQGVSRTKSELTKASVFRHKVLIQV